jgi:hypothetical protein
MREAIRPRWNSSGRRLDQDWISRVGGRVESRNLPHYSWSQETVCVIICTFIFKSDRTHIYIIYDPTTLELIIIIF